MNNLSSYCGLVDAKIRASDKDLPVTLIILNFQTLEINNEDEFLGLAEVPEIKSEPSDEDSFAIVPRYHGPGPCK